MGGSEVEKNKSNSWQDPNPSTVRLHDIGDLLSSMNITRISQVNSAGPSTQTQQSGLIDYPSLQGWLQGIQTELHSLLQYKVNLISTERYHVLSVTWSLWS